MGETTAISWCDHTFNGWIGCTKVSEACRHCYAQTLMETRYKRVRWGAGNPREITSLDNWRKPLQWDAAAKRDGVRRRVFCSSLADVFDADVPDTWRDALFVMIHATPHLDWLLLTKRPHEALRYMTKAQEPSIIAERNRVIWGMESILPVSAANRSLGRGISHFPNWPNVWIGTSVEDQRAADERIPILLQIPAAVRFLSCEPLLGPIEFSNAAKRADAISQLGKQALSGVDWVIVGGESGHDARPMHPDWARSLRDQCRVVGVPFHFKQWGEWVPFGETMPSSGNEADDARFFNRVKTQTFWTDTSHPRRMLRAGKQAGGAFLDGVECKQFPGVA